jgi:hypothetical protein
MSASRVIIDAGGGEVNNCFFVALLVSTAANAAAHPKDREVQNSVSRMMSCCEKWVGAQDAVHVRRVFDLAARSAASGIWPARAPEAAEKIAGAVLRTVFARFIRANAHSRIGASGLQTTKEIMDCITVRETVGGEIGIRDVETDGIMVEGLVAIVPFALKVPIVVDHYEDAHMGTRLFSNSFFRNCDAPIVSAVAHVAFTGNHYYAVCSKNGCLHSFESPALSIYIRVLRSAQRIDARA